MSFFSYQTIKKVLFNFDPETAHTIAGLGLKTVAFAPSILRLLKNHYFVTNSVLEQTLFGVKFTNPVGLGAGFDKMESILQLCQHLDLVIQRLAQ